MTASHGGLYTARSRNTSNNVLTRAQVALARALAELSTLTQDPLFARGDDIGSILADLSADSQIDLDTVYKLRDFSAGHQRVAIELEAAARCCRLIERELSKRVDVLLTGCNEETSVTIEETEERPAIARRRIGRDGWLSEIFRRSRPESRHLDNGTPLLRPGYESPPASPAPEIPTSRPEAGPGPVMPQADIVALALGPLEVHVADRPVPRWNSMKARAVFQYLLVHQHRPTRRDVLMALQWPDHSHDSARNNLNVALYSLRNTLGPSSAAQPILYRDGCYMLNPEIHWWIDRNEFLSALDDARLAGRAGSREKIIDFYHKAIQLYRGPLFEDDGADEWHLPEQRRLQDLYGHAVERATEIHFQLGELPEALHFGQLGLQNDPCSETIHRLLMRCYASRREQQLVARQYQDCTAALRRELGISPSEETTRLLHELV